MDHLKYSYEKEFNNLINLLNENKKTELDIYLKILNIKDKCGFVFNSVKYGLEVFKLIEEYFDIDIKNEKNVGVLHIAASLDQVEILEYLLSKNKKIYNDIYGNTALHYTVLHDSIKSFEYLKDYIKINSKNNFNNTVLNLSIIYESEKITKRLLELDSFCDKNDLFECIYHKNEFVKEILDKLNITKTFLKINEYDIKEFMTPKSTLLMPIIETNNYNLFEINIFTDYIDKLWKSKEFNKVYIKDILNLILRVALISLFVIINTFKNKIMILNFCLSFIIFIHSCILIYKEISEIFYSIKITKKWKKYQLNKYNQQKEILGDKWLYANEFLDKKILKINKNRLFYLNDFWNFYDILLQIITIINIILVPLSFFYKDNDFDIIYNRFLALNLVLTWLSILKELRYFKFTSSLVIVTGKLLKFMSKMAILYIIIYIPYLLSVVLIYGKNIDPITNVTILSNFGETLYIVWNLSNNNDFYAVANNYDYISSKIIVISWFFLISIFIFNLLIALLTSSFQLISDKEKGVIYMQKSRMLIQNWDTIFPLDKKKIYPLEMININV